MQKESKIKNSFTTSHQHAGVQPSPGKQSSIAPNGYLERKTSSSWMSVLSHPPLSFFTQLYMLSMVLYCMEYPFSCWGHLSQLCPLPNSCASPVYSLVGLGEKQKRS